MYSGSWLKLCAGCCLLSNRYGFGLLVDIDGLMLVVDASNEYEGKVIINPNKVRR